MPTETIETEQQLQIDALRGELQLLRMKNARLEAKKERAFRTSRQLVIKLPWEQQEGRFTTSHLAFVVALSSLAMQAVKHTGKADFGPGPKGMVNTPSFTIESWITKMGPAAAAAHIERKIDGLMLTAREHLIVAIEEMVWRMCLETKRGDVEAAKRMFSTEFERPVAYNHSFADEPITIEAEAEVPATVTEAADENIVEIDEETSASEPVQS